MGHVAQHPRRASRELAQDSRPSVKSLARTSVAGGSSHGQGDVPACSWNRGSGHRVIAASSTEGSLPPRLAGWTAPTWAGFTLNSFWRCCRRHGEVTLNSAVRPRAAAGTDMPSPHLLGTRLKRPMAPFCKYLIFLCRGLSGAAEELISCQTQPSSNDS